MGKCKNFNHTTGYKINPLAWKLGHSKATCLAHLARYVGFRLICLIFTLARPLLVKLCTPCINGIIFSQFSPHFPHFHDVKICISCHFRFTMACIFIPQHQQKCNIEEKGGTLCNPDNPGSEILWGLHLSALVYSSFGDNNASSKVCNRKRITSRLYHCLSLSAVKSNQVRGWWESELLNNSLALILLCVGLTHIYIWRQICT